ncbi:MAG TPA: hypothetical protein VKH37_02740, partial [Ferruginibacter sp.]|nr:hypothetical protein [Ferruginibacter sp.]
MKKLNLILLLLVLGFRLSAQSTTAAAYQFATAANYNLANMSGATPVIGSNQENVSTITFDLGFTFTFAGTAYNNFSVNSSGVIGLGTTAVSPFYYEPNNQILNQFYKYPMIIPWSDALTTATDGGVSYKVVTVNNQKRLIIEWRVKASTDDETTSYNKTFQAWLYEGSNAIRYVYGNSNTRDENSYTGIAKSYTDYKLINTSNHTVGQFSNFAWPGAGRTYVLSPDVFVDTPNPLDLGNDGS